MTQENTYSQAQAEAAMQVPTGADIYDALMSTIEPDLLTVNLPLLEEKYKNETAADRAERFVRYQRAYAAYDSALIDWLANIHLAISSYRHTALRSAEEETKKSEDTSLASLMEQMNSAS